VKSILNLRDRAGRVGNEPPSHARGSLVSLFMPYLQGGN